MQCTSKEMTRRGFVASTASRGTKGYGEVDFHSDSWHGVDGGIRRPFQGFTYNIPDVIA